MLKFGAVEAIKESYRDQRGLPFMETLMQDTRHALRRLRKAPAFTITTVLTLALGIGATTSIFTLVHAVLLKSLPVANPGELYRLGKEARCCYWGGYSQEKEFSLVSYDLYKHFRDSTKGFAELAAFQAGAASFRRPARGQRGGCPKLSGRVRLGQLLHHVRHQSLCRTRCSPLADDRPGAPPVAVMSYRLWQQKYGVGSVRDRQRLQSQ